MFIRWLPPLVCFKPSCEKGFGDEIEGVDVFVILRSAFGGSGCSPLAFWCASGGDDGSEAEGWSSVGDEAASAGEGTVDPSFASLLLRICGHNCQIASYQDGSFLIITFSASVMASDIVKVNLTACNASGKSRGRGKRSGNFSTSRDTLFLESHMLPKLSLKAYR